MPILSFRDAVTEDIWNGVTSKTVTKRCPPNLQRRAHHKLTVLNGAAELRDLKAPPGNQLERLKGSRAGQYSIRVNDQYRICFHWTDGVGATDVEFVNYHDE